MIAIVDAVLAWTEAGHRCVLAMLVDAEGSSPRDPGCCMAVRDDGQIAGSLDAGCIDAALVQEAAIVLAEGHPRVLRFDGGSSAGSLSGPPRSCRGAIEVLLTIPDHGVMAEIAERTRAGESFTLTCSRQDGSMLVTTGRGAGPELGDLDFVRRSDRRSAMYLAGANDFSAAMAELGRLLGYEATVVDPRPAFATPERASAARVVRAWPHEFLASAPVDNRTAIVVLAHDEKFDLPLLAAALQTPAGYIGALGSRTTHRDRCAALRGLGISEADIARISGPVGLDIGARTPHEIAVSIGAEIVAVRNQRTGERLVHGSGPVRGLPVSCVVLAAGDSTRMGFPKLVAEVGGRPLLQRALDACTERPILVVASPDVSAAIQDSHRLEVIVNESPDRGMSWSLKLADAAVAADSALLVVLGDMPYLTREVICEVIAAYRPGIDVVVPTYRGERGHPVLLSPRARALIPQLPDGDTIRRIRDTTSLVRIEHPVDTAAVVRDVDLPDELAAVRLSSPAPPPAGSWRPRSAI